MSATLVTLVDGQVVTSCAEEWRHETLARYVLNLPTVMDRRAWLDDFEQRHGKDDADKLRETMRQLHEARNGQRGA